MRKLNLAASLFAAVTFFVGMVDMAKGANPVSSSGTVLSGCDCDECGGRCRGRKRNTEEGKDPSFNCGCQGSYKFPVPPLYTYHWPGMYSAQLMTEYHSPWRFPPLRPYTDEASPASVKTQSANARTPRSK